MKRLLLMAVLGSLSSFFYTDTQAQRIAQPDTAIDARVALQLIRADEQRARQEAVSWSDVRAVPRRIRQRDGRVVELIGVEDGRPIYVTSHNETAAQIVGTALLRPGAPLGLALTGDGLEVGI